jgi:hypothetical protein
MHQKRRRRRGKRRKFTEARLNLLFTENRPDASDSRGSRKVPKPMRLPDSVGFTLLCLLSKIFRRILVLAQHESTALRR